MKAIFLVFLLSIPLFAKEQTINQRENFFETSTPYKIAPHVNPVTGDLLEEENDLIVAGCEPLSVRRFYNHTAIYEPRSGGWRFNPETYMFANFEWPHQEYFAAIGDTDGSISTFIPSPTPNIYKFDAKKYLNFNPSGQNHPLNIAVQYHKIGDPKVKNQFSWNGEITDGSGRKRLFSSRFHTWLNSIKIKRFHLGIEKPPTSITPDVWTPYHLPIYEERLPNGNIIIYSHTKWKKEDQFPYPSLVSAITAFNADRSKELGTIHFSYQKDKDGNVKGIVATGSDGRQAHFHLKDSKQILFYNKIFLLTAAHRPNQPVVHYGYQGEWVNLVAKPEGRFIQTEYNSAGKVSAQYAPVGPEGEVCPIARYEYQNNNITIVYDAENNETVYHLDNNKKVLAIEIYNDHRSYHITRFLWDEATGNLIKKTVEDGKCKPIQITEYQYDKNNNPILEKAGIDKEWRTIRRTFSDDGFNLKLTETDRDNKLVQYSYLPGTNLLISEITYENKKICKRIFYNYDDCAVCTKTITDDGSSEDPFNLQNVTYRKITEITPKKTTPCFGLPEIVEEKTVNDIGQEISLGKIIYTYTPFGKVLKEDHYDANGTYRYSLNCTYDGQECLISQTDPCGFKTTYAYDANHNIISMIGPREDQKREITYDKADRPIRIANTQTDGTVVIIKRKYNKLGQIIEEIDSCNNSTRFEYDALGRIIAICHPDGAIERKEYDILGNVIKEIDPEGYATIKSYNPFGQILSIHYPDNSEEYFSYNTTGTLHSHIDKNGAKTLYTYDIFDHPINKTTYSSSGKLLQSISSTWSPFQKLSETEEDLTTLYTYDFAGRKTSEKNAYQETLYTYDALGRLSSSENEGIRQIKEYDLSGRTVQIRTENGATLQKQEEYAYDAAGNCIHKITSKGITISSFNTDRKPLSIKDPLGNTVLFSYSYGEITSKTMTNPKGIQTVFTYDSKGRETLRLKKNGKGEIIQQSESIYNKNGKPIQLTHTIFSNTLPLKTITHRWEYGPLGRLERFIEAGEKETRYLYDSRGRLQTIIKPDGCQLSHAYDDLGRLARYYSIDFDYHYTYDPRNRVTAVVDTISNTRTLRSYDPLNNIVQETVANGFTFSNTYDRQGRRIICKLPNESTITYGYDGIYLYTVARKDYTHTYSDRNLEGELLSMLTPAGKICITRDALGRPTSIKSPHYTATDYKYDSAGNLLHYAYQDKLGKDDRNYAYDDLDQIIQEEGHAYQFDSILNRLKKDSYDYTINSLCQVTHDGTTNYTYDLCGNLTSDGTATYKYDSLDRLITVEKDNRKTEYAYDPFHRRLSKTKYLKGRKQKAVRFLWDGNQEIGTVDTINRIQELRILGEGLGAEIGAAVLYELKGSPYIPIHDHRGCVVTLVNPKTQEAIECYRYSAFGEQDTDGKLSPWRFSSKRIDKETGFVFFGRRYYHPQLGRWITQDPQGFADGPNLYAYVHNCPLNQIDYYGLWSFRQGFSNLSRMGFRTIEWTGANLLPIPYFRGFVESVGRWGAGGEFRGPSRYRFDTNEIISIQGIRMSHLTAVYCNGMFTSKAEAIKQAQNHSKAFGDIYVDLHYEKTEGLIMDLIGCGLRKLGLPNAFNRMSAGYYKDKLQDDPKHIFFTTVHSRGGIQIMNTGKFLTTSERAHIHVESYGSGTLIPNNYFGSAINNLSLVDIVPMTNPLAFIFGLVGSKDFNVNFLSPKSYSPLNAHLILESTYADEIKRRGDEFKEWYFNE